MTENDIDTYPDLPKSPCIDVCVLDPVTGWCRGCKRTLAEIAGWASYDPVEKQAILDSIVDRRFT